MKKFSQVISIEVPVQSIADLLLNNLHPDFKHKEIVAEAIVGRMMNDNSLGYLYNSLNGYHCNIDFEVGDFITTSGNGLSHYACWTPESLEKRSTVHGYITEGKVININPYSDKKLEIEFLAPDRNGDMKPQTEWIKHTNWNRVNTTVTIQEDVFGAPSW